MLLQQEDKESILLDFPNVKLSYESVSHNKVSNADLLIAIPYGISCFVWFTSFRNKYVCLLLELENNQQKQIRNIRVIQTCYSSTLCFGTVLYGTLFRHKNHSFFCMEDLFYYKNKDVSRENWSTKFRTMVSMCEHDLPQISYNKHFVVFGLPLIATTNEQMETMLANDITYKINAIHYLHLAKQSTHISVSLASFLNQSNSEPKSNSENLTLSKKRSSDIILEIRPDIQNDVYSVYCSNNVFCGYACIPDYDTSTFMNTLFRKIKENDDLDRLEESDDEEEFENPNIDKFVYMDKRYNMKCRYNKRFKKWTPMEVVMNMDLSSHNDTLQFIEQITFRNHSQPQPTNKKCPSNERTYSQKKYQSHNNQYKNNQFYINNQSYNRIK